MCVIMGGSSVPYDATSNSSGAGDFSVSLKNESDVLALLQKVRGSALLPTLKTELRDLLLDYSAADEAGKEASKALVLSKLKDSGLFAEPTAVAPTAPSLAPAASPLPAASAPVPQAAPVPTPAPATPPAPTPTPKPQPMPIPEQTPRPEIVPAPVAPQVGDPQARINEIKHKVNLSVGNPVNLIDKDQVRGREYMNALLDAMKKVSVAPTSAESSVAMARLEQTYQAILPLLGEVTSDTLTTPTAVAPAASPLPAASAPAPQAAPVPTPTPATPPAPTKAPEPQPTPAPQVASTPAPVITKPNPVPTVPIPTPTPQEENIPVAIKRIPSEPTPSVTSNVSVVSEVPPAQVSEHKGLYHIPEESVPQKSSRLTSLAGRLFSKKTADEVKPIPPKLTMPQTEAKLEVSVPTPKEDQVPPKEGDVSKKEELLAKQETDTTKLSSLADSSSLSEKISELKDTAAQKEAEAKKPLEGIDSPEVTSGLEQLLSEWSLFRSSGFLGTGPSGIDHPLYKQLGGLPMLSVISGRFEGATPQIKQSITDYMNGWRYEQGITHDMGESFEHYLRRVILHIMNKQRAGLASRR